MSGYSEVHVGEQVVYIHTKRTTMDTVRCLKALCEAVGVPPAGFVVKVKGTT
jgi:hypothetical protein